MEGSSKEQGGDSLANNDWRTQHEPDLREKVIFVIVEKLKTSTIHQPSENDIKNLAIKFEAKMYGKAKDKDDYLRKINRKLLSALKQGQSLSTSLPYTQTPTSLPQNNIQGSPESSGLPTQVPLLTVPVQQHLDDTQRFQAAGSFHQSENLADQQNPANTSSGGDWREETYQKIKALKEKYVHVLSTLFKVFSDKLREIDSLSQRNMPHEPPVEWIEGSKATLELVLVFLNVSKSSVSEIHRDKFSRYERMVLRFTEYHQTLTRRSMQKKQQVYQQPQTNQQKQQFQPLASSARMSPSASSSPQLVEQQTLLPTSFHKTGTSSQSGGSPFVATPSTNPISVESTFVSNANQIQTSAHQEHPLVTLPPEPVSERPIDRLIKAIQSSSPESLAQSVSEMRSVISLTDSLAGSVHTIGGSRARLGENLSERTRFRLQQVTNPTKKFKRSVTAIPLDSSASSSASKVNKIEPSYALLQEIIEINGRLVETVVNICNDEDVCPSEIVVTCSYVPVALSATFKALYNSGHITQIQPLRLLVPENYPCSPILLDKVLFDTASVHKYEDLSARARTRFGLSMKEYSEPISLKEIAKVWDECARATMLEYAERHGGGTFSSKYGRWESVLRAS